MRGTSRDLSDATPVIGAGHTFAELNSLHSWEVPSDCPLMCHLGSMEDARHYTLMIGEVSWTVKVAILHRRDTPHCEERPYLPENRSGGEL